MSGQEYIDDGAIAWNPGFDGNGKGKGKEKKRKERKEEGRKNMYRTCITQSQKDK